MPYLIILLCLFFSSHVHASARSCESTALLQPAGTAATAPADIDHKWIVRKGSLRGVPEMIERNIEGIISAFPKLKLKIKTETLHLSTYLLYFKTDSRTNSNVRLRLRKTREPDFSPQIASGATETAPVRVSIDLKIQDLNTQRTEDHKIIVTEAMIERIFSSRTNLMRNKTLQEEVLAVSDKTTREDLLKIFEKIQQLKSQGQITGFHPILEYTNIRNRIDYKIGPKGEDKKRILRFTFDEVIFFKVYTKKIQGKFAEDIRTVEITYKDEDADFVLPALAQPFSRMNREHLPHLPKTNKNDFLLSSLIPSRSQLPAPKSLSGVVELKPLED